MAPLDGPLETHSRGAGLPLAASLLAEARDLLAEGEVEAALARLQAVLATPGEGKFLHMAGDIALACGAPEVAELLWLALAERQPWQPRWRSRLARMAEERADYQAAYRIALEALDAWPNDPTLRAQAVRYGSLSGMSNAWGQEALALALDASAAPKARLQAATFLMGRGMTSEARAALGDLTDLELEPLIAREVSIELKAVDILEAAGTAVASAVPGYLGVGTPAVFHRCEGSAVTAIVFTGLTAKVGVPVNVFHALLAPKQVNILYLFDEHRVTHLMGNRAFGPDYDTTIDRLRDMLAAWGTRRLVCIGTSAGGSAAIRYGLDLGAERIVAFGGATTLEPGAIWDQGRARAVVSRMKRMVPHMLVDLKPLIERASPPPRIDLHYGEAMAGDRAYAEHLADLAAVRLFPIRDSDSHAVVQELIDQYGLDAIFAEALHGSPPSLTAHLFEYLVPEW